MRILIDNELHLFGADEEVERVLRNRLTFENPQWDENEKRGFSNWQTPKDFCLLKEPGDALTMPRGFIRQLIRVLRAEGVEFHIEDHRRTLPEVDFQFLGELLDFQVDAVSVMAARALTTVYGG